ARDQRARSEGVTMPFDVRAAKAVHEKAIFGRANVVGVAVGSKIIHGHDTNERCIVAFVERKRPEDELRHHDVVPKEIDGVLTDFVPIRFNQRSMGPVAQFLERAVAPLLAVFGLSLKRLPNGQENLVDAAVAEPIEASLVAPDILDIGRVSGTTDAAIGLAVRKSGRTTALTAGHVTAVDATVEVDYGGGKTAIFRGQIVSDMLSKGGDSGSLVVDDRSRAVGLLFAGGPTTTLINPIGAVMQFLDVVIG